MLIIERLKLLMNSTEGDIQAGLDLLYEEKGWTPPVEPEPEFKAGDYVEVRDTVFGSWKLRKFHSMTEGCMYKTDEYTSWKQCRHAPTWIKWEDGPVPLQDGDFMQTGFVHEQNGKAWIYMSDGRWAWMPQEE